MGLETLTRVGNSIGSLFSGVEGLGAALVLTGIAILLVIGVSVGLYYLVKLIREIPNLTVWELVKYTALFAVALIIVGILLP